MANGQARACRNSSIEQTNEHCVRPVGLDGHPCSDQQPASRQKGNEWLRGHETFQAKTGFSAQPVQPRAKVRAVVAGVGVRVAVAETTRRPCGPRFGLQVGRPGRLAACLAIFACVTSGRRRCRRSSEEGFGPQAGLAGACRGDGWQHEGRCYIGQRGETSPGARGKPLE